MLKHSVRLWHYARPSMQHPETITRGERWLGRLGILHRMGDDGKAGTECFCVLGVLPPSCVQVSGNAPFSLCHGHRVGFRHSDCGAMAETNPVPLLSYWRFLWLSLHSDLVKCLRCRTAASPLDGHRIEKRGNDRFWPPPLGTVPSVCCLVIICQVIACKIIDTPGIHFLI